MCGAFATVYLKNSRFSFSSPLILVFKQESCYFFVMKMRAGQTGIALIGREYLILALLACMHFFAVFLLMGRNLDFLFNDAVHRLGPGTDFAAYYTAGKYWLESKDIYALGAGYGYRYHPLFAQSILSLISILDKNTAYFLWVVVNETMLFAAVLLFSRIFDNGRKFLVASALALFSSPYLLETYMGNSSFIVAVIMLWAFYFYSRNSFIRFSILTTASIIIKPAGLVFLQILVFRKQYWMASGIFLLVMISAVPYFVLNPASLEMFITKNMFDLDIPGSLVHAGNQGLHCLIADISTRLAGIKTNELGSFSQLPLFPRLILTALPFIFIALSAWQNYRMKDNLSATVFVWSATYLLGYKEVWEHSYSFAVISFVHLYLADILDRRTVLVCAAGMALPSLFVFYDLPDLKPPVDPEHFWSTGVSMLHHVTKPVWIIIPYAAVLIKSIRKPAS